ncbi:MAG: AraC family transcriptional regulator [Pseudoclavibacter sp.]
MPDSALERVGLAAQAHSLEAAREIGTRLYYPHRLTPLAAAPELKDFTFTASAIVLGPVTAGLLRYSTAIRIDTDPYETAFQCNVPLSGSLRTSVGEQRVQATQSRAAIYTPDVNTAISGWDQPCVMLAIKLDRGLVERRLAREFDTDQAVVLGPVLDVTTRAAGSWLTSVRAMIARAQRVPELDPGLVVFLAERCIDGFVASTLMRDLDSAHTDAHLTSRSSNAAIVDRALEAITYASGAPLSLGTIADFVGVSARAVQAAFRERLGVSPMKVQRSERLRRVHRELSTPRDGELVGTIARRHGFLHLGRFSAMYYQQFGELPSQTLAD